MMPGRAQRHHFFQEGHEIAAGVVRRSFSVDAAGLGIQRSIQRKRAMAVVLETMTLGAARRERQNRVESIQSLNRGFLIDREHSRVLRRIQVQAENVGCFALKLRIVTGQITLQAVGFEASFFPHAMHRVFADAQRCRQFAAAPMRRTIFGLLAHGRQNPSSQRWSQNRGCLPGMIGIQTVESGFEKALLPADDGGCAGLQLPFDGVVRMLLRPTSG